MDINFESSRMEKFTIEIGYFDSVLEIKEKVERYHQIPVHKQTLIFKGKVLQDEQDVEHCQLFHNSKVQLIVSESRTAVKVEDSSSSVSSPLKIQIILKWPSPSLCIPHEMDPTDMIFQIKDKIFEMKDVPAKRLALFLNGNELQDQKSVIDSGLSNMSEIDVVIKSPAPQRQQSQTQKSNSGTSSGSNSKKLKMMVLTQCGTKKIPVEMNGSDNVGELKKELQKLQQNGNFHLPPEGYFFIYKQNVMEDDHSFRWHHVANGDTIEIFNGSVTGGSS